MWIHGRRLHEFFGLTPPDGRGIIQVGSELEAASLYEDATALGLRSQIRELDTQESKRLLGPLHRPAGVAFETPESPFEEASLLEEARATARAAGAELREIDQPLEILSLPGRLPSLRLRIDGRELEAGATVLAAGSGNVPLLAALGSTLQLDLRQTPTLVIPGLPVIQSPILLDRSDGYSVVAHPAGTGRADGCMVVGTRVSEDVAYGSVDQRRVSPETQRLVYENLPKCLQERFGEARFTAGWEPIPVHDGQRRSSSEPWVERVEDHPDTLVALPGRATLALHAAETVFDLLRGMSGATASNTEEARPALPGSDWATTIHMHHEHQYDGLNDVR
jgi:hypothetical protein